MSYLRFDKTLMVNLQESLPREILRTNKSGAYHCTTIVDCNTRKIKSLFFFAFQANNPKHCTKMINPCTI